MIRFKDGLIKQLKIEYNFVVSLTIDKKKILVINKCIINLLSSLVFLEVDVDFKYKIDIYLYELNEVLPNVYKIYTGDFHNLRVLHVHLIFVEKKKLLMLSFCVT